MAVNYRFRDLNVITLRAPLGRAAVDARAQFLQGIAPGLAIDLALLSVVDHVAHTPDDLVINLDDTPAVIPPVFLLLPGRAAAPLPGAEPDPAADARAGLLPDALHAVPHELAAHPPQPDAAVRLEKKELSNALKPPAPQLLKEGDIIPNFVREKHYGPLTSGLAQKICDRFVEYNFHDGVGPSPEQNRDAETLKHLVGAQVLCETFVPVNGSCILPGKQNEAMKTYNVAKEMRDDFTALVALQALITDNDLDMDQEDALALAGQTLRQLITRFSRRYADNHVDRLKLLSTDIKGSLLSGILKDRPRNLDMVAGPQLVGIRQEALALGGKNNPAYRSTSVKSLSSQGRGNYNSGNSNNNNNQGRNHNNNYRSGGGGGYKKPNSGSKKNSPSKAEKQEPAAAAAPSARGGSGAN